MPCHHIISDIDIENIYKIKEVSYCDININCIDEFIKSSTIDIYSEKKDRLNKTYIAREYHENYELRGTKELKVGKVALHQTFFLKEEYQKLGLATAIFEKEKDIYRENGFKEIHLDAVEDGVIVWRTLGYKYSDEDTEYMLMRWWYEYFTTIFLDIPLKEQTIIAGKITKFEKIPKKYKIPNGKITFSKWLRKDGLVTAEPMYYKLYD